MGKRLVEGALHTRALHTRALYTSNIHAPMNAKSKTVLGYLLVFNLKVEMAAEPIVERRVLNVTSSFQLHKKAKTHILDASPPKNIRYLLSNLLFRHISLVHKPKQRSVDISKSCKN